MARKGQFKKGGGRIGDGRSRARKAMTHSPRTRTITRTKTKYVTRKSKAPRRSRSRRARGGGGINLMHAALATAGLSFALSANSPVPASIKTAAAKIPGAKTFGVPAAVGLGALAVDRWLWKNKWLKLAGIAGVILAASKVGEQGTAFKWVGDNDDDLIADIGDDDDGLGDDDDLGDDYDD